ncbi:MAG TPA: flagellar export protein FliJ [Candidatus Elarobacter sp.]|nr:flagellar export protein FliJ [Candidatus Elarobacter sp.]
MKFRFELQPVLSHRERIEQERAADHSRALEDQLRAERARDELCSKRDHLRDRLVGEHTSFDVETLRSTYLHLDYLDRAIVAAQQLCEACAVQTEGARQRLVDAAKDRKVLETLKDRRREAFELEASLAEQRELDDQNARAFERTQPYEGFSP